MAVRFVIGRAGSGKTAHCFRAIVDACRADPLGPPVYWILPKQATFQAERELTCNSGLAGFCRARVLSFEQLGETILAECGGGAIPEVTPLGRQMLLGHLLRTHKSQLKFFSGVAHQPGLAAKLDATFAEFERSGKDEVALATAIDDLANAEGAEGDARHLLDKLRDFRLLFGAYRAFLGQDRLDPHGRLNQMLTCLRTSHAFRGATVYVDGFAEFTDAERRTLAGLATIAHRVEVALLIDPESPTVRDPHHLPDEMGLFNKVERTYRQLYFAFAEAGVKVVEPLRLTEPRRFAEPALRHAEHFLFSSSPVPWADDEPPVERIEAPDRRSEVDAVARRIRELLHDGKVRLRDIAVLVRDLEPYHELIDASFREHGIPYFVDRRRTAAHHPLVQFVRAAFQVARHEWPHDAVMTLLKSGLAGASLDEADELENYVLLHRIRGAAWGDGTPWTSRSLTRAGRDDDDDDDDRAPSERIEAERADAIRQRFVGHVRLFVDRQRSAATRTVHQTVTDLFGLFERFGVRQTLAGWIEAADAAGEHEQRAEHEQVWAELVALFDQMVDLLGDEQLGIDDFVDVLETGLERFDLALTPPTVDQVLVGAVDRTRCPALDTVFVLGLNDGEFPRGVREDSVLSDAERRDLRRRNVELDPETDRRLLDEKLLGYIALTRASRRLIVTRPCADDAGRPTAPSRFWQDVGRMFHTRPCDRLTREHAADAIGTPRQLVTRLMQWPRRATNRGRPCINGSRRTPAAATTIPSPPRGSARGRR
jgi:ATP-dependent helicase/nuclease subunit B